MSRFVAIALSNSGGRKNEVDNVLALDDRGRVWICFVANGDVATAKWEQLPPHPEMDDKAG